jgi:N-acetyl-gamma-glutamyl-phosphate reductase
MSSSKAIRIGIVGGTGYTGVELLRLLAQHPHCELAAITRARRPGRAWPISSQPARAHCAQVHRSGQGRAHGLRPRFFATPNGVAMGEARKLVDAGVRVIDIAADFRIRDVALWEKSYGMKHACPELVAEAVYGLPEVNRERIREARVVANPGCYPTAVQLGFLPLLEAGIADLDHLIADAKSGVSGAGRRAEVHTLLAEASDNFKAYGVPGTVITRKSRRSLRGRPGAR